jgi:cellulose synthase/poly-beta-1,6-N-acetylglucosamine synthase-like glycosyltransferase
MSDITTGITYVFLFLSLNFEVFLLITYFENRLNIKEEEKLSERKLTSYPSVSIIVPCWNEELTVSKTVHSLLDLDYPKDKLSIIVIDDGSTDNTWQVIQKFKNNPQVLLFTKKNEGSKYAALNLGIAKSSSDLIGCLDADSYVHKDALKKIVTYFEDKETMAVAPSIKLWEPKTVLQILQKVEYAFGIFTRKMYHYMQAIYITPGPFSIFRREVFEKLGPYKKAHHTEDIEIALRMQKAGMKIAHAHNAYVYTVPPKTLPKLLKQRVRWSYGFIKNAADYRDMFFKKQYGNVGMLILPMASISIVSVLFVSTVSIISILQNLFDYLVRVHTVGFDFHWHLFNFDWFYINTQLIALVGVVVSFASITMILMSKRMSEGKFDIGLDLIYYLALYMFIAPLWIGKATWNAVFKMENKWR